MNDLTMCIPETAMPRAGLRPGREPFLSVIVPVLNEEAFIGETLDQLLAQCYDPRRYEILVADGGSTDNTRAIVAGYARRYPRVRLLENEARLSSAGRNVAVRGPLPRRDRPAGGRALLALTIRGIWPRRRRRSPAAAPTAWDGRSRWT